MRNFSDQIGYGSSAADERLGLIAGLLAGLFLIACSFVGAAA